MVYSTAPVWWLDGVTASDTIVLGRLHTRRSQASKSASFEFPGTLPVVHVLCTYLVLPTQF